MNDKNKLAAVKKKEAEISADLAIWVKESHLFSPGESLELTIRLIEQPIVVSASSKAVRYENISNELTSENWSEILATAPIKSKDGLIFLQKNGNRPTSGYDLEKECSGFSDSSVNSKLKISNLGYRLRQAGYDETHRNWTYQMFIVRRK